MNTEYQPETITAYENYLSECQALAEKMLELDPDNQHIINLFTEVNRTPRRIGVSYIFPAGLGKSQCIDGIDGFLSKGDLEALKYCAENSQGKSVNIGIFNGLSAYYIAKHNPNLEVYGIDAYRGINADLKNEIDYSQAAIAEKNLSTLSNAHLKIGMSYEIAQTWQEKVNFLFIDGDHTPNGAISDLCDWTSFVNIGGLIAVHDAYRKVNKNISKIREQIKLNGPDVICQMMANNPSYEFVMVSGCIEVWRKISDENPFIKPVSETETIKKNNGDQKHGDNNNSNIVKQIKNFVSNQTKR